MKIDIHTHTRKCKTGDAPTRDITAADFCEKVLSTDVRIVAITNHNLFDLSQFQMINEALGDEAQVWPGVELDIREEVGGPRGHLLVIVSPVHVSLFSEAVHELCAGSDADNFTATIDQVLARFDALDPLYIAHYRQKKPNLSDEALEKLLQGARQPHCVIREVTNSISAGIYISHGRASIYGSDVHDWAEYEALAQDLPDLRLPVDSFEHFCILLEKDPTTINTALNRKTSEEVVLQPFEDGSFLKLQIYNDINVVFGAKGTGKSCILKAIARHYSEHGVEARVFEPASDRLDDIFDTRGKNLTVNLAPHGIHYCSDEIEFLRGAREKGVTSLTKYVTYFTSKQTNRNAKRLLLKDIEPEDEGAARRSYSDVDYAETKTAEFLEFLQNPTAKAELSEEEYADLERILKALLVRLQTRSWDSFATWKEVQLLNSAIELFRREVERKTGSPAKPANTGFRDYALNRIKIELSAAAIVRSMESSISADAEVVGNLGPGKGPLELRTEFKFQNGNVIDKYTSPIAPGVKKGSQKHFAKHVREILQRAYEPDLFQCIANLNAVEDVENIKTVFELVLFRKYFALNGRAYAPSSGEGSMVMLQKELERDRDIYILDEPERSLGNEYISDVIVPLIKERARSGRKIFISTHDANIAVRTLPYSSVYRCHGETGYLTYVGNPFSNDLVNATDPDDRLDWRLVSMRTLEGGEAAFGERGKIYGQA